MRRRKKRNENVKRYCHFCVHNVEVIDYKDWSLLRRFTSSYGKIVPRRRSGVCAKHQKVVAAAIKRARIVALLPFVVR
ncbi:30S ribosomal protein S18 [Parcubacteria bacterium SG8_24]|nr:MAG: 30S ribosomal protein S18 [Parcubacteria bacterium SG8_24]